MRQSLLKPILDLINISQQSMTEMQQFRDLRKNNNNLNVNKVGKGETYVVVLGEASNRRHYSSYGYFRDTTPWLKSLRNNSNVLFLENAYTSYVHTVPALLNVLTSANQYNEEINFTAPSIIEVSRTAGFKTYWFSNKHRYSLLNNPLTTVAEEAENVYFTPKAGLYVDGKLNDLLEEHIKNMNPDDNNIIIINLMGSHAQYKSRLPKDYPIDFKESGKEYLGDRSEDKDFINNVLNPYDATVKYTDENLQRMYNTIKERVPDLSAYIYVPDHGEDVFGGKQHNASVFNFEMARVPFVMIFSDKWKNKYPYEFEHLKQNKNKPFTTDLFFEYLLGVANIKSDLVDKKFDIGSEEYKLDWNNAMTMWTNKKLQTQFYAKTRVYKLSEDPEYVNGHLQL